MGSINTHRSIRRLLAGPILAIFALGACGGDDESADGGELASTESPAATIALGESARIAGDDSGGALEPGEIELGVIGRDVIVEMHVTLRSDDIRRSVSSISASAARLGGGVASSDVQFGAGEGGLGNGFAVLVVKVPPGQVNRLLDDLDATGEVLSLSQSAQDVTEQLVDLDVRIDNARQSVANVRGFMERTQNLNELVTLEAELTRRQTELEQLEAQQRNLSERVALATLTIEIMASDAGVDDDGDTIGDAFAAGWDAFMTVVFGLGYVLAVLAPFIVLVAIAGLIAWRIVPARRQRPGAGGMPDRSPAVPAAEPVAEPVHEAVDEVASEGEEAIATPTG
jgi:Na+-transporting methylmalonyl-CoA/oxaloacetate decarboxylase gamma subunit